MVILLSNKQIGNGIEMVATTTKTEFHKCDADCPSRAGVRCTSPSGDDLFFCNHHYAANAAALSAWKTETLEAK